MTTFSSPLPHPSGSRRSAMPFMPFGLLSERNPQYTAEPEFDLPWKVTVSVESDDGEKVTVVETFYPRDHRRTGQNDWRDLLFTTMYRAIRRVHTHYWTN